MASRKASLGRSRASRAVNRRRSTLALLALVTMVGSLLASSPALAVDEIVIPVGTVVRAPEGSLTELASVRINPDDVGQTCLVTVTAENQSSVHPGNDLIIASNGSQVVAKDVEREPGAVTFATGLLTIPNIITVSLLMGPDEVFSGGLVVTFDCTPADITVVKDASPTQVNEPGDDVTFSVSVTNDSVTSDRVTITSLLDDIHGDITLLPGDCSVPQVIAAGDTYSCSFVDAVNGQPGDSETDTVTASGTDDDGIPVEDSDSATVTIADVPSMINVIKTATPTHVAEPGATVTFSVTVENTSLVDTVTITSLVDDVYGDLDGQGDCSVPQVLAPAGTYSCEFTALVGGQPGDSETDTVTASGTDDDGDPVENSDNANVIVTNVPSSIDVDKMASVPSVDEPGGNVTFSVTVENTSLVDTVTITSLVDDVYGDLDGQGDCSVPQVLAPAGTYSCEFTVFVAGDAGDSETDTVTASGTDDDGDPVEDSDDETVDVDPVLPVIDLELAKTVDMSDVLVGASVVFTVSVTNQGPDPATGVTVADVLPSGLSYLSDDGGGDFVSATGVWTTGSLAVGATVTLKITASVDQVGTFTNTAEVATANEDDVDSTPGNGIGNGEDDQDKAAVSAQQVLASGLIGDFVWLDTDTDGNQDAGEPGIGGVTIRLTNTDTSVVSTKVTAADGMYLFSALAAGNYLVVIDLTTAPANHGLTTVGSYTLALADGEHFLTADFGLAETLPPTGMDLDDYSMMGLLLLLVGAGLLLMSRAKTRQDRA